MGLTLGSPALTLGSPARCSDPVACAQVLTAFELEFPTSAIDIDLEAFLRIGIEGLGVDGVTDAMAAVDIGEGGSIVLTAEELKKRDAEELAAKKASEAKKAKEKDELDRLNQERDAALAASGKRAAGGLHKFDPDEVDVHGGNASVDDFMDAFG